MTTPPDSEGEPPLGRMSGFRELVDYRVTVWQPDFAEIQIQLGPEHMNRMGIVHGGVHMTLLDAAMGHAATFCTVEGNRRGAVTVSMTTQFLAASRGGVLIGRGYLVGAHGRNATCRGEIVDDAGALLMASQASFRYLAGAERPEGVPPTSSAAKAG
ncbi:MAG: PaaI family thioesterase [Pseudomonadota bacterium]